MNGAKERQAAQAFRVHAVVRSPERHRCWIKVLAEAGCAAQVLVGELRDIVPTLEGKRPDLWLVEADLDDRAQAQALEAFVTKATGMGIPVLVAMAAASLQGVRALLRLGVADVLPLPLAAADLVTALSACSRRSKAAAPPSARNVLSFLKAGGGAGATTIVTQAAFAMASAAKPAASICLLDFDVQFGSIAFHLDLPQQTSILDVVNAADRLDGSMLRGAMAHHGSGIDVLPAPAMLHSLDAIDADAALRLVETARQEYSTVLMELPQAWTAWTRTVLAASTTIVLVLQPTVPSARHARRQLDTIGEEGLDHIPVSLIANRIPRGLFARGIPLKEVEAALGRRIDQGFDDYANVVADAVNAGRSLGDTSGGRRAARQLARVAGRIIGPESALGAAKAGG